MKVKDPDYITGNELAQIVFPPQQSFIIERSQQCEVLGCVVSWE